MPSVDRLSFMVVFLGLPLAIYVVFVIYPFGQALYYSMTDWSGFSADVQLHRAGQLPEAVPRRHLHALAAQQRGAGDRRAVRDHRAGARHRDRRHRGWAQQGQHPRDRRLRVLPGRVVLPLHRPGHRHRPHLGPGVRPVGRHPQRHPHQARLERVRELRLARRPAYGDAGVDVRDHLELRRLLHGAVRRRHQGHSRGLLRGRADGRRRPVPDGDPDHAPARARHRADGVHLSRDPRPRRVRLHAGPEPERRPRQHHADDEPGALQHRVPQGPVRLCHRDGGRARRRDAALRRARVRRSTGSPGAAKRRRRR